MRHSALVLAVLTTATCAGQTTFPDHCGTTTPLPLPFAAFAAHHPIDNTCGISGKLQSSAPTKLQNSAKNNFCAPTSPTSLTPKALIDKQAITHVPTGQGAEPTTRAALQAMGEGTAVRMKAFVIEAHHADVGTGESVNCGLLDEEGNDIHIALGTTATTPECASVTAEISPHFRPTTWNEIGHFQHFDTATNKDVVNEPLKQRLQAQAFRFTGQLFFDASHAPCPCGTNCHPSRSSDWELHPVYAIDVCKTGTPCNENNNADWTPFDTWWKSLPPLSAPMPPAKKKDSSEKSVGEFRLGQFAK